MDVIGIDGSVVDHIVAIDKLPGTDEEIWMKGQSWQGGGKIATAMVAVARLGGEAGLLGVNGDDVYGDFIRNDLIFNGVDTKLFIQEKGTTGDYCIALAEKITGGRSFIGHMGDHRTILSSDLDEEYIKTAKCVHLYQFTDADIALAEIARKNGLLVGFDGDEYSEDIISKMNMIDIFIGSEFFYKALFGDSMPSEINLRKVYDMGPAIVIFTFGSNGCAGYDSNGYFELPAYKVDVLDSTGAGDVFHGAFLYAYIVEKMTTKEAARFSSAVSAIKCQYLGGRAGIPTREIVEEYMKSGEYDSTEIEERVHRYSTFH